MKSGKILGIALLIGGAVLIVYGINHMNTTESEIKDFFGKSDTTGMVSAILGAVLAIAGATMTLRKGV